jgi:hypothetical protein
MRLTALTALVLSMSVTACSPSGDSPQDEPSQEVPSDDLERRLIGSWQGQNETRGAMSFSFAPDQTVTWIVQPPSGSDTLHVSYTATARDGRLLIDLSGFESGPLSGLVMYGLVEFAGQDTLDIDLEPGPPGDEGPRPAALTSPDVMTLVRSDPF